MDSTHNEHQSTSRDELSTQIIPTHFLVELTSLDELAFPANSTKRVKYTCVASTSKSLLLGTSTGSVYIFSRYAAKSRSSKTSSPVPVQVFTTRDGQISTICVSSSEELIAIGGDSGRVSVAQMAQNGAPPTLLYSTPGDARSPDRVTALAWSPDLKSVFSGHLSGNLHIHRLSNRSVFRATHQKLFKFPAEITQLDAHQDHVLIATSLAAHLFHVEKGAESRVGTKPRGSPSQLGAIYLKDAPSGAYIVAARPNGRLWEANLVGHVYKTHQYRQSSQVPRSPPVSFRCPFPTDSAQFSGLHPENQDLMLNILKLISVEKSTMILSAFGSRICLVETESSQVICVAELEHEILDFSTCGNDVFVLLAEQKGLRKFSIFDRKKTAEKLVLKNFWTQCAQFMLFCAPNFQFSREIVRKTVEGLAQMSKKRETEKLAQKLEQMMGSASIYENNEEKEHKKEPEQYEKLPNGVHRVLQMCSGYDDDFSFDLPKELRARSKSSEEPGSPSTIFISKRASEPANLETGAPDVLHRARQILEDSGAHFIEKESLRVLLQLEEDQKSSSEIKFSPTVTLGNAAKALAELALAVPVDLESIWRNQDEIQDQDHQKSSNPRKPTIVKVVRPGIRSRSKNAKPTATVSPSGFDLPQKTQDFNNLAPKEQKEQEHEEFPPISEEMRRKQDEMWLDLRLSHIKQKSTTPTSEAVPKSDTDYTLTTENSTPQDEIWRNPLDEEPTPTGSASSKCSKCSICGMHRSWAAAALLTAICGKIDVLQDDFARGAIPKTMKDWQSVLRHICAQKEPVEQEQLCPRCEMSLSTVERVCIDGWKMVGACVEEGTKANKERIWERCKNTEKEKLMAIVTREKYQEKYQDEPRKYQDEQKPNQDEHGKYQDLQKKYQDEPKKYQDAHGKYQDEQKKYQNEQKYQDEHGKYQDEPMKYQDEPNKYQDEQKKYQDEQKKYQDEPKKNQDEQKKYQDEQKKYQDEPNKYQNEHGKYQDEHKKYQDEHGKYQDQQKKYQDKYQDAHGKYQDEPEKYQNEPKKYQDEPKKYQDDPETLELTELTEPLSPELWNWTRATNLRTILALAVFCIGKKSVLQIIGSDEQFIARRMAPRDWCAIVVMGAREQRFRDLIDGKTISSILETVGVSGWVSPRKSTTLAPKKLSQTSREPANLSSWIVDANGKCPICTLCIKMIVGGSDRGVVSYCCGHAYHKMCLAGRFTIGCLACRVRARRATNGSTNGSAASSPLQSPRHPNFVR